MSAASGATSRSRSIERPGDARHGIHHCFVAGIVPSVRAARRRTAFKATGLVLLCQLVLLVVLLGAWEWVTAQSRQTAFLFGSPSAIFGFLVGDVAGREPVPRHLCDRHGDRARLPLRQRARHAARAAPLVFALRLARGAALHRGARLDSRHRARADGHHLVRDRARLEDRHVDAVGGRGGARHVLQGRDERRRGPGEPDAHARRPQARRSFASSWCPPRSPTSLRG